MCSLAQAFSPLQTSRLTFGICVCIGTGISVCLPHTLRVLLLFLQQRREVELGHRRLGPTASVHGSVCMCVCACVGIRPFEPLHRGVESVDEI